MSIKKGVLVAIGLTCSIFLTAAVADTCPTDLKRNHSGYWYSDTKPGWKSHRKIKHGVTVKSDDFGGIVYSPKRKRMACVYRASNGKWVALVSKVHHGITIDKNAKTDNGKKHAWKYSKKHKDYACGRPDVVRVSGCSFQLNN